MAEWRELPDSLLEPPVEQRGEPLGTCDNCGEQVYSNDIYWTLDVAFLNYCSKDCAMEHLESLLREETI